MVIGETFIWAHNGKCGGNSVVNYFQKLNRPNIEIDDIWDPGKHHTIGQRCGARGIDHGGRIKVLNIRRLPTWIQSYANQMRLQNGTEIPRTDLARGILNNCGRIHTADEHLQSYLDVEITHWLRLEHLCDDFISVFADLLAITDAERSLLIEIRENENDYTGFDRTPFTENEIKQLYANNSLWRDLETRLYGDLYTI